MASAILVALSKVVYFPLIFFISVIPAEKFGVSINRGKIKKYIACAIPVLLGIAWCLLASTYLGNSHPGANAKEQFWGILRNPVRYIWVIVRSVVKGIPYFTIGIVQVFTVVWQMRLSIKLVLALLSVVYLMNCVYMFLCGQDDRISDNRTGKTAAAIIMMEIVLIFSAEYMQWTKVGAAEVDGVQGRYFLPVMVLMPLVFVKQQRTKQTKGIRHYLANIAFDEKLFMGIILVINVVFLASAVFLWL